MFILLIQNKCNFLDIKTHPLSLNCSIERAKIANMSNWIDFALADVNVALILVRVSLGEVST